MRVCATCGTTYADNMATCPACGSRISADAPAAAAADVAPIRPASTVPTPDDGGAAHPPPEGSQPIAPWRWGCFGLLIAAFVLFVATSTLLALSPSSSFLPFPLLLPRATRTALPTSTAIPVLPADQATVSPTQTTGVAKATATPTAGHSGGATPTPTVGHSGGATPTPTARPSPTATTAAPTPIPTMTPGGTGG